MNQIKINLEFGGALLPIVKNEAGQEVVPLKPISDEIGLKWEEQRIKLGLKSDTCTPDKGGAGKPNDGYYVRRLGICMEAFLHAGQTREMVAIRLDRVAAFLYTINPDRVRNHGNEAAADYLERKHTEWDDLIHAYEAQNGQLIQQVTSAKIINIRTFLAVSREIRMVEDKKMRGALGAMAGSLATDVGIPYQPDLLDATSS